MGPEAQPGLNAQGTWILFVVLVGVVFGLIRYAQKKR